jgi:uncharacterized protein
MGERIKASRYNHFVEIENGKRLAFNALSCGLAEMDEESYRQFSDLMERGQIIGTEKAELLKNLRMGGFLVPESSDELEFIRAIHYQSRFGNDGFGLTIIPTHKCNLACQYCFESNDMHAGTGGQTTTMSEDVCAKLVHLCEQRVRNESNFGVTWYGGEPLLALGTINKLTDSFVSICETKKAKYGAALITNGYSLTSETLKDLIRCKISFVQVTLDGPRAVHNARRPLKNGNGSFDRIVESLCTLATCQGVTVSLRVNIDKSNANDVEDLFGALREVGLNRAENLTVYFGQTLRYSNTCRMATGQCMHAEEFSRWSIPAFKAALDSGFRISVYPSRNFSGCGAVGTSSYVVEPDGTISACWVAVGGQLPKIGSLTDMGIQFTGEYTHWLGYNAFRAECGECSILPICMGGCPVRELYPDMVSDNAANRCNPWLYSLPEFLRIERLSKQPRQLSAAVEGGITPQQSNQIVK